MYRVGTHGIFGKWYKIEKRFFGFLWVPVDDFFDTKEEAVEAIKLRIKTYN